MKISSVEDKYFLENNSIIIKDKLITIDNPLIMGILNITPDSFHQGSRTQNLEDFAQSVMQITNEGADIIDIGGFSTRPNATFVNEEEELKRIAPILDFIEREFPNLTFSLDTFRSKIAQYGLDKGIAIINDVSGGIADPNMMSVVGKFRVPYILMHGFHQENKIHPTEIQFDYAAYLKFFDLQIKLAQENGIHDIILDPGFGFGKNLEDNYYVMKNLTDLHVFKKPILVGISRKSMLTKLLEITTEDALNGTTALNTIALMKGAKILRVHDVKEAVEVRKIITLLG